MRNFLRRINRGIVLAVLLLIALVCYLNIISARFEPQRTTIQEMVSNYAKQVEQLNVLPEQAIVPGQEHPVTVVNQQLATGDQVFDQYLVSFAHSIAKDSLENVLMGNMKSASYVTACQFSELKVTSLQPTGANQARGDIKATISLQTLGTPMALAMFMDMYTEHNAIPADEGPENNDPKTSTYTLKQSVEFSNVLFTKVGDDWKIAELSSMMFNY